MEISKCIYRLEPLSVINEAYPKFSMVLNTAGGNTESCKNLEQRFDSKVCSYNLAAPSSQLQESIMAFLLSGNANIDNNQRFSILSASAPKANGADNLDVGQILEKITCEDVPSVIRSLDKPRNGTGANYTLPPMSVNSSCAQGDRYRGQNPRRLTEVEIKELRP